jgi:serine/threonine protein phosphatase PrpC
MQIGSISDMSQDAVIFDTGAKSHTGLVRTVNEDSYLTRPGANIWAVSDGMGGYEGGRIASNMVVNGLLDLDVDVADPLERAGDDIGDRLKSINTRLLEKTQSLGIEMAGATLALLVIRHERVLCVWCGDSRVYRIRRGRIEQLTHDHSEVEDLVRSGALTRDEARVWPRRNVITRALGVRSDAEFEMVDDDLEIDDVFVLCSDGLTTHVDDEEIARLAGESDAQIIADQLVHLTLERGARDNVTVVIVRCEEREITVVDPTGIPRAQWVGAK